MKIVVITLVVLLAGIDGFIHYLLTKKPKHIDQRTYEVYDKKTYQKWDAYNKEKSKLSVINKGILFLILITMLILNLHFEIYHWLEGFSYDTYTLNAYFFLIVTIIPLPIVITFDYIRIFKIEEKYGFNTQTKKLFIKDKLIETITLLVLETGIVIGLYSIYEETEGLFVLFGLIVAFLFMTLTLIIYPIMSKLYNKFSPLEEGSLKASIHDLLVSTNSKVSKVLVMNASKRSKKMNAYFTGIGKRRRIVLYDTTIEGLEESEIVAVLAHELGHAKHKDIVKMLPLSFLSIGLIIILLGVFAGFKPLSTAFGFSDSNFVFSFIILFELFEVMMILIKIPQNKWIRSMEYKADQYAVTVHDKASFISALIKLSKMNLTDLNPHPLIVTLLYDHPTLFQRIDHIGENHG